MPVLKPPNVANVYTLQHHPHKPFGEKEISKNVISALRGVYDEVNVFSFIDRKTHPSTRFESGQTRPDHGSTRSASADHHVINYPYLAALKDAGSLSLLKGRRWFFYSMTTYNRWYRFPNYVKSLLGKLLAISTSKLLTTSRVFYNLSSWTSRVTYLPTPIDPHFFSKPSHEERRLDNQLLYIGNLSSIRFPVKAMIGIFRAVSNAGGRMKIITPCTDENRAYAELIKRCCLRLRLQRHIEVMVQNLTIGEKIRFYRSSNAFVFPSIYPCAVDPPVTALEAMASGCVVISTDLLSLPYILGDERGVVVNKRRLGSELKQAVLRVLFDKDFSSSIRENALAYARRHHTAESTATTIRRLAAK